VKALAAWQRTVGPHFDFLLEHGFAHDPGAGTSDFWATSAVYRSAVGAVQVVKSTEFRRVEVRLARLVDGAMPEPQVFVEEGLPIDEALLDTRRRGPGARAEAALRAQTGLGKAEVERQLAMWASVLREVAPDFLAGSDDALIEAEAIVRERVRRHPQRVTVWTPAAAPDDTALAEVRATVPSGVEVTGRAYAPPQPLAARIRGWLRRW
jgi:hypothetical protein